MSIGLGVAFLAMILFALAMLLVPLLLWTRRTPSRDAYNLAVYRDQLAEVARDHGRGLLDDDQAAMARAEIGRRVLALRETEATQAGGGGAQLVAASAVLLLPAIAAMLYWHLGSPALPDQPIAERHAAAPEHSAGSFDHLDIEEALRRLAAHLKAQPEDLTGWLLMARTEMGLGRAREAAEAYRHADDLSGHRADISADLGEALILAADGTVTADARAAFEIALKDPENAPRARYYLALARLQAGDIRDALQMWRELLAGAPADAAWLPLVRRRIVEAESALAQTAKEDGAAARPATAPWAPEGAAPPLDPAVAAAAQAAASASPADRRAMIDAMVARLAARLVAQPDDVAGWARLGRSYMVLDQPKKARDAYAHAVKLQPNDASLQQALSEADAAARKGGPAASQSAQ